MKVSILVPVYNEEKTIVQLIKLVLGARLPTGFTKEIIVINDASSDNTLKLVKKFGNKVKLVSHSHNQGKGAAIRSGLAVARGNLILIQDADLEYDPQDYVKLLQPFSNKKCQAVYGSRLKEFNFKVSGKDKTPLATHFVANKVLTWLTNTLYQAKVTDMETCYKVIERKLMTRLNLTSNRFEIEPEITAKLLRQGVNILEVPIKVKPRTYKEGKKIKWRDGLKAIWVLTKYRF